MTRTGKIARLPLAIREELNQRLQDGQPGTELIEWLNTLPDVQAVLELEFAGEPVSDNNLSAWKNGGYLDWEQDQSTRQELEAFLTKVSSLKKATKDGLADQISLFLAAKMALELVQLDAIPDRAEKSKARRELLDSLALLRRSELDGEKLRFEREERNRLKEPREKKMTADEKQERIRQIMGFD